MDTQTIDQEYQQLQTEFQDVAQSVQVLAAKLQDAVKAGDANAREWQLDLKQIALDIKDEQVQVNALLQAIHGYVANAVQSETAPAAAPPQAAPPQAPPPPAGTYQQQPAAAFAPQAPGGMMGGLLGGGFARAMEAGAGIGIGQGLINSIF